MPSASENTAVAGVTAHGVCLLLIFSQPLRERTSFAGPKDDYHRTSRTAGRMAKYQESEAITVAALHGTNRHEVAGVLAMLSGAA